jgi:hypothetical protein
MTICVAFYVMALGCVVFCFSSERMEAHAIRTHITDTTLCILV